MIKTTQQLSLFTENSLPRTMILANDYRRALGPRIRKLSKDWPFEDKVLAYLLPNLKVDIDAFHTKGGPCLGEILKPHQLLSIDQNLEERLTALLKKAIPDQPVTVSPESQEPRKASLAHLKSRIGSLERTLRSVTTGIQSALEDMTATLANQEQRIELIERRLDGPTKRGPSSEDLQSE